ncbi:ABC transporter ATP-binding protein [Gynuella sunshinyii]|uniref:ABC-type multidrug transport system, ATPase and permease component n=1 Tax=Gynuella sunshinyii YC6258 TaxID=1445510 RepID=A0A0C5VR98_9GAMM|nr:ABC transporter ATP-binding protein [Gynuella sunshinyii]AJQ95943.1 ABC-type multidrug transport system, ATPase and permease component [Gynuella sunshinyii YC6258]
MTSQNFLLFNIIKRKKWHYVAAALSLAIASLFLFLVPTIGKLVIDRVISSDRVVREDFPQWLIQMAGGADYLSENLWIAGLAIVLVTLISGLFMFLKDKLAVNACESTVEQLRNRLYFHLHLLPNDFYARADSGDILQRCTSDIDTLKEFLTMQVMNIGRAIILLLVVIPLMLLQSAWMTLLSLMLLPVVFLFAVHFFGRVKQQFLKVDEAEGELTTIVQENLTGIRVVRAFARQQFEIDKFEEKNRKYFNLNIELMRLLSRFWSTSDLLCFLQTGTVLIVGAWLVSIDMITLGTFFAFLTYTSMVIWPIRELGKELSEAGKAVIAISRIQEILDESEEADTVDPVPMPERLSGNIRFDKVSFAFDPDFPVLRDISFDIHHGQTVAIVGPTGAGKSMLVQLLLRIHDYQQGSIQIDGIELNRLDRRQLRHQVGVLLQEPFLFSRSLKENIRLSDRAASDGRVYDSAMRASVHHTIENFEHGYETVIGERGVSLSGGQRQRVTLSRTLLKESPILILDDTLSAVDSLTERRILKSLMVNRHQQTRLIITHRISVCQQADIILVLQNGRLAQQGTHESLLSESGFYRQLWDIQSGQKHDFDQDTKIFTKEGQDYVPAK